MADRIRGRVAQIISETEIVINRGAEHGVNVGMRFAVLNSKGANIVDPDTGEEIGSIDVEKTLVKVVRVAPLMSVARTYRVFTSGLGVFDAITKSRSYRETLRIDGPGVKKELSEEESFVKIGDTVVQAVGEEFDEGRDNE